MLIDIAIAIAIISMCSFALSYLAWLCRKFCAGRPLRIHRIDVYLGEFTGVKTA